MRHGYLIPTVSILLQGYDCTIDLPAAKAAQRVAGGDADVLWRLRIIHNGEVRHENETVLKIRDNAFQGPPLSPFIWRSGSDNWGSDPAFVESSLTTVGETAEFTTSAPPQFYVIYSAPGRKTFFSDSALKYASPPVIDQIAAYGRFVDSYPPVCVDRNRDYDESLVLINPYRKTIIANIVTSDGRRIRNVRVPYMSARSVSLNQLLRDGEERWQGRIQLSANNRVITFDVKHALANPQIVSDCEHLDPFRADPTHLPAFQWIRQAVGKQLVQRGLRQPD